ncbi:hypothetical protein D9619_010081 [Psilocybe cf. subviscida]|uniref:RING-type domain-containing protein n=1 Tax=Psilocybe cf. subviscida TaxID=2480587 RepID=A0A8H5F696_9AGAR|nr:hypothetical protein D9619_010081 [Psilocybe cf. subviscida]
MPPKKRAARTVPKPTIMVEPNLPPDLPAPTTTRNRQPRAQTTFSSRTTRQSALRLGERLTSMNHTRPAMTGPGSSSRGEVNEEASTQGTGDFGGSESHQHEEDQLGADEDAGYTPVLDDVGSASAEPSSTGHSTPLSDAPERPEYAYQGHGGALPGSSGSSSLHTWPSAEDQQPSAGASSSSYISGAKRKRSVSEPLNEDAEEPPASQVSVKRTDKGKGKATAASQVVDDSFMDISSSPVKPHPPSSSQDASAESSSSHATKGKGKGKGKARAVSNPLTGAVDDPNILEISDSPVRSRPPSPPKDPKPTREPLSAYTCPICFGAPTNATLTPCGHICCGACLFAAVKATMSRAALSGPVGPEGRPEARCPVCRAVIPHWDGKGRGVIGLQIRASLNV